MCGRRPQKARKCEAALDKAGREGKQAALFGDLESGRQADGGDEASLGNVIYSTAGTPALYSGALQPGALLPLGLRGHAPSFLARSAPVPIQSPAALASAGDGVSAGAGAWGNRVDAVMV